MVNGNEKRCPSIGRLYTAFYRPDWPWHLLLVAVVGGLAFL
jgi:hypothetical protein